MLNVLFIQKHALHIENTIWSNRQNMYILNFIRIQTPNILKYAVGVLISVYFFFFHFWPLNRSLFLCTPDHFTHVLRSVENRNSITNRTERMEKWKKNKWINKYGKKMLLTTKWRRTHAIHGEIVREKKNMLKPRFLFSKFIIIIKDKCAHCTSTHNRKSQIPYNHCDRTVRRRLN